MSDHTAPPRSRGSRPTRTPSGRIHEEEMEMETLNSEEKASVFSGAGGTDLTWNGALPSPYAAAQQFSWKSEEAPLKQEPKEYDAVAKSVQQKQKKGMAVLASVSYSISSCGMTLMNKAVLSSFKWQAPVALMLFQNVFITIAVFALRSIGAVKAEPISWPMVKIWLPSNIIFVGMLVTSFLSLQYLQVAMATILKNCTNVLTALGESYLQNTTHGLQVWASLFLLIASAFFAGYTDLSFHPIGYSWQAVNCVLTAAYSLTLRRAMKNVRTLTPNNAPLQEFTMVYLNSLLSLPFGAILSVFFFNELPFIMSTHLIRSPSFLLAATLSAVLGLTISSTSMWCLHLTSPTTHGLVGSINRLPLAILGIVLFQAPTSVYNLASVFVGVVGGVLFAHAKAKKNQQQGSNMEKKNRSALSLSQSIIGLPLVINLTPAAAGRLEGETFNEHQVLSDGKDNKRRTKLDTAV